MPARSPGGRGNNFRGNSNRPPSSVNNNRRVSIGKPPPSSTPSSRPAWQPPRNQNPISQPRTTARPRIRNPIRTPSNSGQRNPLARTAANRSRPIPRPSAARLPETLNSSGLSTPMRGVDPPRPALPSNLGRRPQLSAPRPRGLPRFAGSGAVAVAGVGGLLDFGLSVAMGEDPRRAGYRAASGTAGAILGAGLGTTLGPVGTFVGGMIGGAIGSAIGSAAYDAAFPSSGSPGGVEPGQVPVRVPSWLPFSGGQLTGVAYIVRYTYSFVIMPSGTRADSGLQQAAYYGPVSTYGRSRSVGEDVYRETMLRHRDGEAVLASVNVRRNGVSQSYNTGYQFQFVSVLRQDGQPDTGGNRYEPAPTDAIRVIPGVRQHPMNTPNTHYVPSSAQRSQNGQGNAPLLVPSGRPNPRINPPAPDIGRNFPTISPSINTPGRASGSPAIAGRTLAPSSRQTNATASPFGDPRFTTIPVIPALARANQPQTGLRPPPSPDPPPPSSGSGNPCSGNGCGGAIRRDVQNNSNALQRLQDQLNALNLAAEAGSTAAILRKLEQIDNKLGSQVNGGLSGFLGKFRETFDKFSKWAQLDRVLNVLTFITVIHNAFMLSNSLAATLNSAISNGLSVFGVEDPEGNPLDIGGLIGDAVESAITRVIGAENYATMNAAWKKANRIYQATANIIFSLQSIGYSILEATEVVGNYVALIGNSMRKFGVVTERAFGWMNPDLNFMNNRFFRGLQNVQEAVESVDIVAGEVLNIQQTVDELTNQRTELERAVAGLDENGQPLETVTVGVGQTQSVNAVEAQNQLDSLSIEVQPDDLIRGEVNDATT